MPDPPVAPNARPSRPVFWLLLALLALGGVAATWTLTPLRHWLRPEFLADIARPVVDHPLAPVIVWAGYLAGAVAVVPINALLLTTALLFPPLTAFSLSWIGALLSAVFSFGLARLLGRDAVHRMAGERVMNWSRWAGQRGVLAVIAARLLPLGPYSLVNLAAGVSHLRFRDFLAGNMVALAPIVAAVTILGGSFADAWKNPSLANIGLVVAIFAGFMAVGYALTRWLSPAPGGQPDPPSERLER